MIHDLWMGIRLIIEILILLPFAAFAGFWVAFVCVAIPLMIIDLLENTK